MTRYIIHNHISSSKDAWTKGSAFPARQDGATIRERNMSRADEERNRDRMYRDTGIRRIRDTKIFGQTSYRRKHAQDEMSDAELIAKARRVAASAGIEPNVKASLLRAAQLLSTTTEEKYKRHARFEIDSWAQAAARHAHVKKFGINDEDDLQRYSGDTIWTDVTPEQYKKISEGSQITIEGRAASVVEKSEVTSAIGRPTKYRIKIRFK